MKPHRRRLYLVARGASCLLCIAHSWKAFREPEERDCMSPCTRDPICAIEAENKREAVAIARTRFATEQEPREFLDRHINGDWGVVSEDDKRENEYSVQHGFRILSAYTTSAGDRIRIMTEADRSTTTILLPDEY